MFRHLSSRSRAIIESLVSGDAIQLGGRSVKCLTEDQVESLRVIASQLSTLESLSGKALADQYLHFLHSTGQQAATAAAPASIAGSSPRKWKLGILRATAFRGLAPADQTWEYDFARQSHLLHGPNGCGKSSMLGAVCWVLTGHILRDDQPPAPPEHVATFTAAAKSKVIGQRPDALALLTRDGHSTDSTLDFQVTVQLISDGPSKSVVWVRRASSCGLETSPDAKVWTSAKDLSHLGISAIDAELKLLTAARVPYLRFGKDSDALRIFSAVMGLDDLDRAFELAGKCHRALARECSALEKEIDAKEARIKADIAELMQSPSLKANGVTHEHRAFAASRQASDVETLSSQVNSIATTLKQRMASVLRLQIPEPDSTEFLAFEKAADLLPGHIEAAVAALTQPPEKVFPSLFQARTIQKSERQRLHAALEKLQEACRSRLVERLDWTRREAADQKANLKLTAAAFYSPDENLCPLCEQDLTSALSLQADLAALLPLVGASHLQQEFKALERALVAEIDALVSPEARSEASSPIADRFKADWARLQTHFRGLTKDVAARFESELLSVAGSLGVEVPPSIVDSCSRIPSPFDALRKELLDAHLYLAHQEVLAVALEPAKEVVGRRVFGETGTEPDCPMLAAFRQGESTNVELKEAIGASSIAGRVASLQKQKDSDEALFRKTRARAEALDSLKPIGKDVRKEVLRFVRTVEPQMKVHYEALYECERLTLDHVTTGHAANPEVKDEFNVYLRSGGERVPIGPFSNAGRLRALTLSFLFALIDSAQSGLSVLVFDDPAISLDDEHKARFVDRLIKPLLDSNQVILATHYENFYRVAEPVFQAGTKLLLPPRRTVYDAVSFEPSDLLQRLEETLKKPTADWREVGINLRRWGERTLQTLSGYSPRPFAIFNNLPGSIDAYSRITDPRVATDRAARIVAALGSAEFGRVMHRPAHDEDPTEAEVRDALRRMTQCRKDVDAEIEYLKGLHRHGRLGRGIEPRPTLTALDLPLTGSDHVLVIEGGAAAASNGVGVTWHEKLFARLNTGPAAILKGESLAPIALHGQFLLLDSRTGSVSSSDLVIAQTEDGRRFARRLWVDDHFFHLEVTNPVAPEAPAIIRDGECKASRIIGVLFEGATSASREVDREWAPVLDLPAAKWNDVVGIKVIGSSMKPIAEDGQIVLVRRMDGLAKIQAGDLACVEIESVGAVIKRCYPMKSQWVLCPINPVEVEDPIIAKTDSILHAYPLVGVLFDCEDVPATDGFDTF